MRASQYVPLPPSSAPPRFASAASSSRAPVPLAEEVVRHAEEPQRVVDPLARADSSRASRSSGGDRLAIVAAVELEPAGEELRLLRPTRVLRIRGDDLVVPGDRVVVVIGARQRARAVEHRLRRARRRASRTRRAGACRRRRSGGACRTASCRASSRAACASSPEASVGHERELGDRLIPQVRGRQLLRALDALGGGERRAAEREHLRARRARRVDARGARSAARDTGRRSARPRRCGTSRCRRRRRRRRPGRLISLPYAGAAALRIAASPTRNRRAATRPARRSREPCSLPSALERASRARDSPVRSATMPRSHAR